MHAAAGYPEVRGMRTKWIFSAEEKETLRTLARKVSEIAASPVMAKKAKLWTSHNDLKTDEPLVFIDPENGWNEIIPADTLVCEDPLARVWEMSLRKSVYWAEGFKDDRVIEAYFDVPYSYYDDGWGLELSKRGGENGGSFIIDKALKNYETDFPKLHYPNITIDRDQSDRIIALAHDVFDGILAVRRKNAWWWTLGMCWDFISIRGLEDFMVDMITEPDNFHKVMDLLCEGKLKTLDFLEQNDLLALNDGGTYVGSGGMGFTDELPGPDFDGHVTTKDMWGFVESQETVCVSPEFYKEFILPYHIKIAERFGLNCYGCCEIYDTRWEYVRQLPRLRRVSCSPWSDWSTVPGYLGKDYIASIKLNPALLAVKNANEDDIRADCRKAVEQTKGGICEFIMKDNHTLGGNPENAKKWVTIMREEIEKYR